MAACIVLGVASLAIAFLFGSRAFAQSSPAPTDTVVTINTANKFQQVLASSGTARRMLALATTIPTMIYVGCLWEAAEPPKKVAILFQPARSIFATHRLCHRTRSKQPASLVRTPSMSNINKKRAAWAQH